MANKNKNYRNKNRRNYDTRKQDKNPKDSRGKLEICKCNPTNSDKVKDPSVLINNPAYYFDDMALLNQFANVSYNQIMGAPYFINNLEGDVFLLMPALMRLDMYPSIMGGTSDNGAVQSSIGRLCSAIYTTINARNGKLVTQYTGNDVLAAILAVGSILEGISFMKRAFAYAYTYDHRNRAFPKSVFTMMGINAADFLNNIPQYRQRVNNLITRLRSIPIPSNIAYLDQCIHMYDDIYTDMPNNTTAQLYMMVPASLWKLSEIGTSSGSTLQEVEFVPSSGTKSFANYIGIMEEIIGQLLNSTTLNFVYADILHYIESVGNSVFAIDIIPDTGFDRVPIYNYEALLQIANLTVLAKPLRGVFPRVPAEKGEITCYGNDVNLKELSIQYDPVFPINPGRMDLYNTGNVILNFMTSNPTPIDVVEATRYSVGILGDPNTVNVLIQTEKGQFNACRSSSMSHHYCVNCKIFTTDNVADDYPFYSNEFDSQTTYRNTTSDFLIPTLCKFRSFDWHPPLALDTINNHACIFMELNFIASLSVQDLLRINDVMTLAYYMWR